MKIRYIPAGVTLLAGALTSLICIMKNYDVTYSLEILLVVLILFACLGFKAQKVIMNVMHEQQLEEEERIRMAEWKEAERIRKIEAEKAMMEQEDSEQEEETEEPEEEPEE